MEEKKTINARYIIHTGTYFDDEAPWPQQNSVTLAWDPNTDEEHLIEFVYFGSHNNRLVYLDVNLEASVNDLT